MNRWVFIPGIASLVTFGCLLAVLSAAPRRGGESLLSGSLRRVDGGSSPGVPSATLVAPLNVESNPTQRLVGIPQGDRMQLKDAEQALGDLTKKYLGPKGMYDAAPHRMYSRAAPRPIPSTITSGHVELAHDRDQRNSVQTENLIVATVVISKDGNIHRIPCVIDRQSKDITLFAGGRWMNSADWLKTAATP